MSRMSAIRDLAKSGAGAAAIGAGIGGAGAYATGGDIATGISQGAMIGGGARMGAAGMSKLAGSARLGIKKHGMPYAMGNLNKRGMRGAATGMSGAYSSLRSGYKSMKNFGAIKSGMVGGGAAVGFATLGSNQGLDSTMRNASLNTRLKYEKARQLQRSALSIRESQMKKQIWQSNR